MTKTIVQEWINQICFPEKDQIQKTLTDLGSPGGVRRVRGRSRITVRCTWRVQAAKRCKAGPAEWFIIRKGGGGAELTKLNWLKMDDPSFAGRIRTWTPPSGSTVVNKNDFFANARSKRTTVKGTRAVWFFWGKINSSEGVDVPDTISFFFTGKKLRTPTYYSVQKNHGQCGSIYGQSTMRSSSSIIL